MSKFGESDHSHCTFRHILETRVALSLPKHNHGLPTVRLLTVWCISNTKIVFFKLASSILIGWLEVCGKKSGTVASKQNILNHSCTVYIQLFVIQYFLLRDEIQF